VSPTTISNDPKALDELAGLPGWAKRKVQRLLARLALEGRKSDRYVRGKMRCRRPGREAAG
jgi:hypothetical protein